MRYYTGQHQYYCGVDLHARTMYLCIVNQADEILVHREIPTDADRFLGQLAPYREVLRTIPDIGPILSLVLGYEIQDISRFPKVQQFASYARLIRPVKESAGKRTGTANGKMGNAYVKWAFSEAVVLVLRETREAHPYIRRLERTYDKNKAKSILAHRLGRTVYSMLTHQQVFDLKKFVTQ